MERAGAMKDAKIPWRDYDWNLDEYGESLAPLALDVPGRIINCPGELLANKSIRYLDWIHAMAMLCQQHYFIVWCDDPADALAYYSEPQRAWDIQVAAAAITGRALDIGKAELMPRHRFGYGERMAAQHAIHSKSSLRENASLAGINTPRGQPLLRNVWIGCRINEKVERKAIGNLCKVPAAVRFLYIPSGYSVDFQTLVWTTEAAPAEVGENEFDATLSDVRRLHWVICGGISVDATQYHIAQCIESGTPVFVEAARTIGGECAVQMFPAEAGREPLLTPEGFRAEWRAHHDERRR
jgi:hypothetical protein